MISPPSPRMKQTPMTARFARTLFFVFVARHIVGVIMFAGLIYAASRAPQSPWWMVVALTLGYAAFAAYNGVKLFRAWKRRAAAEAGERKG